MGTNFGNIHVRSNNKASVIAALREISAENAEVSQNQGVQANKGFGAILAGKNQTRNVYFIGEPQPGWVSILNDHFQWGQTEVFGERLSSYLNEQLLTISYFDDDVFEMNVYADGEQLTGHAWAYGGMKEEYGLEEKHADLSLLAPLFGHQHIGRLNDILAMENCEQAVEALQELIIYAVRFEHLGSSEGGGEDGLLRL